MKTDVFYFNPEILLIIYGPEQGWKKPQFVLKSEFDFRSFALDQEPKSAQLGEIEITTEPNLWSAFTERCSQLQIEPDACISAFLRFLVNPNHREAAERLLLDSVSI